MIYNAYDVMYLYHYIYIYYYKIVFTIYTYK